MSFEGKTAIVTGGSRGIGAGIVRELLGSGCEVVATSTSEDPASVPAGSMHARVDLSDAESTRAFCERVEAMEGLDILVNNAGINRIQPIEAIEEADWRRILEVNLTGTMLVTRSAARVMKRAGRGGRMLNLGSIFSVVSKSMRDSYSASKTGLIGLTRACALDLAADGVLVNALCPGPTATELTASVLTPEAAADFAAEIPLGRFAQVEEMAKVARFLLSEENSFMTGQTLLVDGGFTAR